MRLVKHPSSSSPELNNNNEIVLSGNPYGRRGSSISSDSTTHSDSSDEDIVKLPKEDVKNNLSDTESRRWRSKSDGAPGQLVIEEIFPSLPDSVLQKLGLLHGEDPRGRLSEEELEQKFVTLALAFTIDAATIKDRSDRQRRYRDQTETNLNTEIDRLIEKVHRIQPLCVDAETAELLAALLAQIDLILRAAVHAAISAEKFGAMQHEERLSECVNLMINHVTSLKQQRDSARKQLQYTKRVLQGSQSSDASNTDAKQRGPAANRKLEMKRRFSIGPISQQFEVNRAGYAIEVRKIVRRPSDTCPPRHSSRARTPGPSRLELGVDLVKINEGTVENGPADCAEEENIHVEEEEDDQIPPVVDVTTLNFSEKLLHHLTKLGNEAAGTYQKWTDNGTLHDICYFGAFASFSLGLLSMIDLLIELECGKHESLFCWMSFPFGKNLPIN